jgi:hypothetical protein
VLSYTKLYSNLTTATGNPFPHTENHTYEADIGVAQTPADSCKKQVMAEHFFLFA